MEPSKEAAMTLDDVYGSDFDRFPLEQETAAWVDDDPGLIWDEAEVERMAYQLGAARPMLS
jgi:hypothetical protein